MTEPTFWVEFLKLSGSMGVGGLLLGLGIWFVNKDKVQAQSDLKVEQKARIDLLEHQNKVCNEDRIEIHRQMNADRTAHSLEIAELRKNHDAKIAELNGRILDLYKSRDQKVIAEKMAQAATVFGNQKAGEVST